MWLIGDIGAIWDDLFFQRILGTDIINVSRNIALGWMPLALTDESMLIQVIASHYRDQYLSCTLTIYGMTATMR